MYYIKVRFDSNVKGVYSEETETSDNEYFAKMKYQRSIDRWLKILVGDVSIPQYVFICPGLDVDLSDVIAKVKLNMIEEFIKFSNKTIKEGEQERKFSIFIEDSDK